MRTLVIGDIHGGLKALEQVLEKSNFDYTKDKLIFLGDYVDGWSESSELIQYLIDLQQSSHQEHIFLRGNHDKWCEDWLLYGQAPLIWTQQGGQSTLESYIKTQFLVDNKHREFFKNLRNYYIDDQNRGFVHGGFKSKKGLGHEVYEADYYWDRDMWQLALFSESRKDLDENATPQSHRFLKHKEIYIGHTSTVSWKAKGNYKESKHPEQVLNAPITIPMNRCNVWNLDTGGGWGGKLTIMDIDSKEWWQSDFVKDLYPNEKGR